MVVFGAASSSSSSSSSRAAIASASTSTSSFAPSNPPPPSSPSRPSSMRFNGHSPPSSPRPIRRRSSNLATTSGAARDSHAGLKMKLPELVMPAVEQHCTLTSPMTNNPKVPQLPNELLLLITERIPTTELLNVRQASRRLSALVDVTLESRLDLQVKSLFERRELIDEELRANEIQKRPLLRYYRQFLRHTTNQEVTEATWYASPPEELKTVCACLCILKGPGGPSSPVRRKLSSGAIDSGASDMNPDQWLDLPIGDMTWPNIKKFMTRYDFKTWFCNLRVGVDGIAFSSVKQVERIIMEDPNVTYERLREVSMAGYKLLIVVAACLQYGSISEELDVRRREIISIEKKVLRYTEFLRALRER